MGEIEKDAEEGAGEDTVTAPTIKNLEVHIDKLSPQDGDILVVQSDDPIPDGIKVALAENLQAILPENMNIYMLFLKKSATLTSFPESEMNRLGWFRLLPHKLHGEYTL